MAISRNQACPCGSGKKYKHCCLASGRFEAASPAAVDTGSQLELAKNAFGLGDNARAWRALEPLLAASAPLHGALGLACRLALRDKQFQRAYDYGQRAVSQQPSNAASLYNFATAAANAGRQEEAVECYRKALVINPGLVQAYHNLANTLRDLGRTGEALDCYRKAFDGGGLPYSTLSNILLNIQLFCGDEHEELYRRHCALGEMLTAAAPEIDAPVAARHGGKVRLAYLSPRFSREIVGWFFKPLFDCHDRERFDISLYSATTRTDDISDYLRERADRWVDVSRLDDAALGRQLREDGIDILVDLAGHAPESRIGALAGKPVPVQVSMLDYFDTTGLPAMDYFVSDRYSTPESGPQRFSEQLLYLSQPRLVYEAPDFAPDVTVRAPEEPLVFGSFNRAHKIVPQVVAVWSQLLQSVPGAQLLLKSRSFDSEDVRSNLLRQFADRGVEQERIEFRGASGHAELLAEYGDMDIALDTFPYNGGLTTCEALWMGTPVITLVGQRLIGRQSGAMLEAVGLGEFAVDSAEAFVEVGKRWAGRRRELNALRVGLRQQMAQSPLCNGESYARDFEGQLLEALQGK